MFVWWHQDENVGSWLHRLPVVVCGSWLYELSDGCMHLVRHWDRRSSRDREHLPTLRTTPSTIWPVFSHQRKGSRAAIEDRLVLMFRELFCRSRVHHNYLNIALWRCLSKRFSLIGSELELSSFFLLTIPGNPLNTIQVEFTQNF